MWKAAKVQRRGVTKKTTCPGCGAALPPDARPAGLCPACLLSGALEDHDTAEAPAERDAQKDKRRTEK